LQQQILEEEVFFDKRYSEQIRQLAMENREWNANFLRNLHPAERQRFLHRLFREEFSISLQRNQLEELSKLISTGQSFSWNAPRGLVLRCSRDASQIHWEWTRQR